MSIPTSRDKPRPELSVIIPCFNAAATIGQQLEALSRQECERPWEVLLCDNGSTDGSVAEAERYRDRLQNLRIIDASSVRGPSHARNAGVEAAAGNYLLFCDADDEVGPGWLAAMAGALDSHPMVAGAIDAHKLNPAWLASTMHMEEIGVKPWAHPPCLPTAAGANVGYRREVRDRIGTWDESLRCAEDADFAWRAQLAGFPLHRAANAVVHYRIKANLRDYARQAQCWGTGSMMLRRRYDPKLPPLQLPRRIVWLCQHVLSAPWLSLSKSRWTEWIWEAGFRLGLVKGALPFRGSR